MSEHKKIIKDDFKDTYLPLTAASKDWSGVTAGRFIPEPEYQELISRAEKWDAVLKEHNKVADFFGNVKNWSGA